MSYGRVQCGPPMRTRNGSRGRVDRRGRMHQVLVACRVDVALGTERQLGGGSLGPLVDQRPHVPVVGPAVEVALNEILLQLRAERLQQIAHVAQHRVIAQHRMPALKQVVDTDSGKCGHHHRGDPPPPARQHCQRDQPCRGDHQRGQDEFFAVDIIEE